MFNHFQTFSKHFSLSLWSVKASNHCFCRFPSNFFKDFCPLRPVRPFCPSFFIYFHVSCILGRMSNQWKFGDFDFFNIFFQNWSMGFCYGLILTWSVCFNLINLMNWENFNFLGLKSTRIGVFVQLSLIWWNWLVRLIDVIIILCYLSCVLINLVNLLDFWKWVFKFGIFWFKLFAQANFVILRCNWIYSHCIRTCIMCW